MQTSDFAVIALFVILSADEMAYRITVPYTINISRALFYHLFCYSHCAKTSGDERRSIVKLFHKNIEALSSVEDVSVQIDRASDILYFLSSDLNFGLRLMAECVNAVLNLYASILSHFLQRSW